MSKKISAEEVSALAAEAVNRKIPGNTPTKGGSGDQEEWLSLRAQICRLLLSDPDAAVYFYYLASNSVSADLRIYHALVCECIVLIESLVSAPEKRAEDTKDLNSKRASLRRAIAENRNVDLTPSQLNEFKVVASSYVEAAAKSVSKNKRVERGSTNARDLFALLDETQALAQSLIARISSLSSKSVNMGRTLGPAARSTIMPFMTSVIRNKTMSPEDQAIKIASAVGAYEAFSRNTSALYVVNTGTSSPYPLVAENSGTTVTLRTLDGKVVSPSLLGISTGMRASSGSQEAEVSQISNNSIELSSEISTSSGIKIQTAPQRALESFIDGPIREYSVISLRAPLAVIARARNISSRPEAASAIKYLLAAAAPLAELTPDAARSLRVLNIDAPTYGTALADIKAFDPQVPNKSKSAARSSLDALRAKGFDVAETALLRAQFSVLETDDPSDARRSTKVSGRVAQLMGVLTPKAEV